MSERKPDIRFEGFRDNWSKITISDSIDFSNNLRVPVTAKDRKKGNIPYYGANGIQDYISGFTHSGEYVLLAEDGANDLNNYPVRYVNGKIWVNNHAHVLKGRNELIDNKFLSNIFKVINITRYLVGGSRYKLNANILKNIEIIIPDYEEQKRIGEYFNKLDKQITNKEKELDKLNHFKQAMLQKMFPKEGETVPEIRFEGFKDEWFKTQLGEMGNTISGIGFPEKYQKGKTGIPFLKVSDMELKMNQRKITTSNNYVNREQISTNNWSIIENIPCIIFAKVGAALKKNRKRIIDFPFLIDNNMMAYTVGDNWDINFAYTLFETIYLPKYGQTGALPSFNDSVIQNIEVVIPTMNEQSRIGNYFYELDKQITNKQKELDKLKQFKQAMLDKMFV